MIDAFILEIMGTDKEFTLPRWYPQTKDSLGGQAYFAQCAKSKVEGRLWKGSCMVNQSDIASTRDNIIVRMQATIDRKLQKTDLLCLYGSSDGAWHALALAAVLQKELTINYICLADLPMFAGGRKPSVPGVDASKMDPPLMTEAKSTFGSSWVQAAGSHPKVSLVPDVTAKVKENFFQAQGNAVERSWSRRVWFWTSGMSGEVHGEIANPDWTNNEKIITLREPSFHSNRNQAEVHKQLDDLVLYQVWPNRWPVEVAKF